MVEERQRRVYVIEPKDENRISRDLKALRGISVLANNVSLDVVVFDFESFPAVLNYCNAEGLRNVQTKGNLKDLQIDIIDGNLQAHHRIAYVAGESRAGEFEEFAEFLGKYEVLAEVRQIY